MNLIGSLALVLGAIFVIGLVWRYAYFCPSWLVPLLENPYVEAVAGAALLMQRAGLRPGMQVLDAGCGPGRITLSAAQAVGAAGRVATLLFGVSARDPIIYASVAVAMLLVTIAASFVPAHRAASVDPNVALRSE